MKKYLMLLFALLFITTSANAEFVATGKVTKFHVATNNFGIYLSSSNGCPSDWYYSYKKDMNTVVWKMLFDLSLSVYENGKTLSIFHTTAKCDAKRFIAIDTVN